MKAFLRPLSVTMFLTIVAAGQMPAKPNFSGEWKMNAQKSNFGPLSANAPSQITRSIQHSGVKLSFKTVQTGAQAEVVTEMNFTTDGKETLNALRGTEIKGNAKWNGELLVIETRRSAQGVEIGQSDQWSMEEGGKSMKVESSIVTPKGNFQFTVVFDKQTGEKNSK